ncbi:MAG: hypothetical protein AB9866_21470 [Syntrophobacteraceae bacterium]
MHEIDDERFPGGIMTGFMLWMSKMWDEWHRVRHIPRSRNYILSESEILDFDQWLQEKGNPKPPYWQCVCGFKAMPLTDDTECLCEDYYDHEWTLIEPEKQTQEESDEPTQIITNMS